MSAVTLQVDTSQGAAVAFRRDEATVTVHRPIVVVTAGGSPVAQQYDDVDASDDALRCTATVQIPGEVTLQITDDYRVAAPDAVALTRRVEVSKAREGAGIRVRLEAKATGAGQRSAWQYFLPCTLYNRNDSDGDGVEDYLGTFDQTLRDDKNGLLAVLTRCETTGAAFSLARTTLPTFDAAVTSGELLSRTVVQATDIGSLGFTTHADGSTVLHAAYPFHEETSFCLDTAGSGWEAFRPVAAGDVVELGYEFRIDSTPDLTEAIWNLFERQRALLGTRRPDPGVSLDGALEYRQLATQLNYRRWTAEENPKEPAGFLVHFSPRTGHVQGSLIEFGFSGDQTLVAWAQLEYGYRRRVPLYRDRARSVLDFFVRHCQLDNGMPQGIYDPVHDRFVYWFTGILMPFQYAVDEEDVRHFVGKQMARELLPVARELRTVEGNYTRTMCESFWPLLLAYELEAAHGNAHDDWLAAACRFGEFLLRSQSADGSWFRAYGTSGEGLTSPASWFGASDAERKSGTIFPAPVLVALHRITGDERYLAAARKAADFLVDTYVEPTVYIGGLNDTTHVKSVKTDAVGVMFLMRSLLTVHEATGDTRYLEAAVKAAKVLSTWVYLWDVPMPEGTLLARAGFRSTGWAGCDVIASGSYLDNEFLEFTADLVRVAELSGERSLFEVAELVEYGMQHALSTPDNDHGYVAPGLQCEGVLTSYWLSAPDVSAFSGAVNKLKGDDNDTCNALTNAQAAYGLYLLGDRYGSTDFTEIRHRLGWS